MWGNCPFYCDLIWQPKADGVQEPSVIPDFNIFVS
jgi:hypothetical protein